MGGEVMTTREIAMGGEVPAKGWFCGECHSVSSTFRQASNCCRAELLGHGILNLADPEQRKIALEDFT